MPKSPLGLFLQVQNPLGVDCDHAVRRLNLERLVRIERRLEGPVDFVKACQDYEVRPLIHLEPDRHTIPLHSRPPKRSESLAVSPGCRIAASSSRTPRGSRLPCRQVGSAPTPDLPEPARR